MDNSSEPHSPLNEEFAKLRKFLIFIYLRPGPQIVKELEAYFCLCFDYLLQPFRCQIFYANRKHPDADRMHTGGPFSLHTPHSGPLGIRTQH